NKIRKGKETDPTHLIIEGDNYHALSVLNYTHAGKIDLIYIDPPYNTGNKDFIYNDRFVDKEDSFRHSKWLSFMAHRLRLAKNLLTETGVIFISIDDNEQAHLRLLCDQIFGEENFIANFTWVRKKKGSHLSDEIRKMTEYVIAYKKKNKIELFGEEAYKDKWQPLLKRTNSPKTLSLKAMVVETTIPDGKYIKGVYGNGGTQVKLENNIVVKDGKILNDFKITGRYVWTQSMLDDEISKGTRIAINSLGFGFNVLRWDQADKTKRPSTLINDVVGVGTNEDANEEIKQIFGLTGDNEVFKYAKPVSLIEYLVLMATKNNEDAIILDFFAGSGTTGHAVLKLNVEKGGMRQFILCSTNDEKEPIVDKVLYPRIKKVIDGYGDNAPIPANLRYFQTDFVEKGKNNDQTRADMVARAVDMINVREATYEKVEVKKGYVLSQSATTFTAIIFDSFKLADIWKEIEKKNTSKLPVKLYIFSFSDDTSAFTDMIPKDTKLDWESKSIPEGILQVYQRLFKKKNK
ncbi:MAG: site-specific DNA-methyltransferase, partial [Candidatus Harrisonbacteria bacterium]|nr:site-specific DNA-methyltransferase [Candidatus Harrisonbacteria bacterium]